MLVANKSDLPGFRRAPRAARAVRGARISRSSSSRRPSTPTPLLPWLAGQHTALIGQSGMGKSTILNAVAPDADAHRRRRYRRRSPRGATRRPIRRCIGCPPRRGDGWIVDSPGMKVFGLAHIAPETIAHAFVELRPFLGHCRFRDCRHRNEPGCAVREAVDDGRMAPHRLALLHELVAASTARARRGADDAQVDLLPAPRRRPVGERQQQHEGAATGRARARRDRPRSAAAPRRPPRPCRSPAGIRGRRPAPAARRRGRRRGRRRRSRARCPRARRRPAPPSSSPASASNARRPRNRRRWQTTAPSGAPESSRAARAAGAPARRTRRAPARSG